MQLTELINGIKNVALHGKEQTNIQGIQIDSRQVKTGDLFVAVKGTQTDGHAYIDKAIAQGATAICCETLPETLHPEVTYIKVKGTEELVGQLATRFYGNPSAQLRLVGV